MNNKDSPIILNLTDNEYVTIYSLNVIDDGPEIEIDYRYTGDKSEDVIKKMLSERINTLLEQYIEEQIDGR